MFKKLLSSLSFVKPSFNISFISPSSKSHLYSSVNNILIFSSLFKFSAVKNEYPKSDSSIDKSILFIISLQFSYLFLIDILSFENIFFIIFITAFISLHSSSFNLYFIMCFNNSFFKSLLLYLISVLLTSLYNSFISFKIELICPFKISFILLCVIILSVSDCKKFNSSFKLSLYLSILKNNSFLSIPIFFIKDSIFLFLVEISWCLMWNSLSFTEKNLLKSKKTEIFLSKFQSVISLKFLSKKIILSFSTRFLVISTLFSFIVKLPLFISCSKYSLKYFSIYSLMLCNLKKVLS